VDETVAFRHLPRRVDYSVMAYHSPGKFRRLVNIANNKLVTAFKCIFQNATPTISSRAEQKEPYNRTSKLQMIRSSWT
jgi:hypothetical protein